MQHNGQTTAEIQEEVALTNLEAVSTAEKHHSNTDKFHFPRADLQTITTLGKLTHTCKHILYRPLSHTLSQNGHLLILLSHKTRLCPIFFILRLKRLLTSFCYVSFMCPLEKSTSMPSHPWCVIDN